MIHIYKEKISPTNSDKKRSRFAFSKASPRLELCQV